MAERGRSAEGNHAAQPVPRNVGFNAQILPIVQGVISPQQYMVVNQKRAREMLNINFLKQLHDKCSRDQLIVMIARLPTPGAVPIVIQQYEQIPYN